MIYIDENISIDEKELNFDFIRSSGPGGQNVNKVSSAVQLRFDIHNSSNLHNDIKQRLIALGGRRISGEGVLVIKAQRHRTQEKNRQDAINRLIDLVKQAAVPPAPRIKTRPTRASRERRLTDKLRRSQLKQNRKPVDREE